MHDCEMRDVYGSDYEWLGSLRQSFPFFIPFYLKQYHPFTLLLPDRLTSLFLISFNKNISLLFYIKCIHSLIHTSSHQPHTHIHQAGRVSERKQRSNMR